MPHRFGELLAQYRLRKQDLSQARLAELAGYDPAVITRMGQGKKDLTGPSGRDRIVRIIDTLLDEGALRKAGEANALLAAADMPPLYEGIPSESLLIARLATLSGKPEASQATPHHSNLPSPISSFVGRETEIRELIERIKTNRLVTLVGAGGIGKTRLAVEVARAVVDTFTDGVWFIEFAAIADPELLPHVLMKALKLHEHPGQTHLDHLAGHLKPKHALLVLDNCEHVIEGCTQMVEALLQACPRLCVLATSRENMRVSGESLHRVPPFLLSESMQLFLERTRAHTNFIVTEQSAALVASVCQKLDGIPLAVELAAARMNVLSLSQLAAGLNDQLKLLTNGSRTALTRHTTLQGVIDWSYRLLTPQERDLFCALSIFANGFSMAAAEAICSADALLKEQTLDVLSRLIAKSLIVVIEAASSSERRYRLLEPIRQFGSELLKGSGKESFYRQKHLDWYLAYAEEGGAQLHQHCQTKWLNSLELEHDNLRVALDVCQAELQFVAYGVRIATALHQFWITRGYVREGCARLETLLAIRQGAPDVIHVDGLYALGRLTRHQDDAEDGCKRITESLMIARNLGYQQGIANALCELAVANWATSNYASVLPFIEESLSLFRALGDKRGLACAMMQRGHFYDYSGNRADAEQEYQHALALCRELENVQLTADLVFCLATLFMQGGQYHEARTHYEEALSLYRSLDEKRYIASVMLELAWLLTDTGGLATAKPLLSQALSIFEELGLQFGYASVLDCLGHISCAEGSYSDAEAYHRQAVAIFETLSATWGVSNSLTHLGCVAYYTGDFETARQLQQKSLVIRRELGVPRPIILCLERFAQVEAARGAKDMAARLLGITDVVRRQLGLPRTTLQLSAVDQLRHLLQTELGETEYSMLYSEGELMTLNQVVEYVLTS